MRFPKPALVLAIAAGMTLSACGSDSATKDIRVAGSELSLDKTVLVADSSGVEVSQAFFPDADKVDSVVVAGGTAQHRWEGAQEAIKRGIPLLVDDSSNTEAINAEIERLGVKDVVRIGDPVADAQQVAPVPPAPDHPTDTSMARQITELSAEHGHLDGGAVVLVSQATSAASVATAKASGATVEYLSSGDPRESATLQKDAHAKVLGLGPSFSNQERFHRAVDMLQGPEVPGGGHLIFPEHRLVALYGHPSGGALGVMGEQPAPEAVSKVKELTDHYAGIDPQTTTVPAFEIIATVASADPGPDGNYSNEGNIEELGPWVDEIGKAAGMRSLICSQAARTSLTKPSSSRSCSSFRTWGLLLTPSGGSTQVKSPWSGWEVLRPLRLIALLSGLLASCAITTCRKSPLWCTSSSGRWSVVVSSLIPPPLSWRGFCTLTVMVRRAISLLPGRWCSRICRWSSLWRGRTLLMRTPRCLPQSKQWIFILAQGLSPINNGIVVGYGYSYCWIRRADHRVLR